MAGEFLTNIKKKFEDDNDETVKVTELKKLEQGEKIIKEFVQEFKKVARGSSYKEQPLIKDFKET